MADTKKQLLAVQTIQFGGEPSDETITIAVTGLAAISGWESIALVPLEKELSSDGILDLDFVGIPPKGISLKVLTPVQAHLVWRGEVKRLVGVNIHSRSGQRISLLPESLTQFATTLAIGEEGPGPGPTTLAFGEEGPGPGPTTLAFGEEGPGPGPTTLAFGEEGPGPGPTTFVFGEEGPGPGPTTLAIGEEGPQPTTFAFGEEGPSPTTLAMGEEGPQPTTFALGEEGPTTFRFGEEGSPKPPFGETSPMTDDPGPGNWFDPGNPNPFGRR